MKHKFKIGNCIKDNDIKFIKKLIKKKPISFSGQFRQDGDCIIKISNIRKYNKLDFRGLWSKNFCYEVDLIIKTDERYGYVTSSVRTNDRIRRYKNKQRVIEELSYFNIEDIQISKVTFEK